MTTLSSSAMVPVRDKAELYMAKGPVLVTHQGCLQIHHTRKLFPFHELMLVTLEGEDLTSALLHRNENFSHCKAPEACKLSKRLQLDLPYAHDDIGFVLPGADRST
uniref:Uncharacterized protein n=1 Tax=Anopheles culicifacies TaxID=139723 RepID=A0A182M7E5_9DIPT